MRLVKIFAETKYVSADITPEFRERYIQGVWKQLFASCENAIRTGQKYILIDEFCVNHYGLAFPAHERENVYRAMLPELEAVFQKAGIPFSTEPSIYNPTKVKFKIDINDLRLFSDHTKLESLL